MEYLKLFFIASIISWGISLHSQNARIEWYHQEDGLPNDLIKSFAIDSLGFIWVATDDGLVKMEGRNNKYLSTPSMFSNNFKNILISKQYGILTTVDAGLLQITETYEGIFSDYFREINPLIDFPNLVYPKSLFEGRDSSIWIADLHSVYRIHNSRVQTYSFADKNHTDHFSRSYQFFYVDSSKLFVLSQKGYLFQLNEKKNKFEQVPWNYQGRDIYTVKPVSKFEFLVGCEDGMVHIKFDKKSFLKESYRLDFPHSVSVIKRLNEGAMVVGTWTAGAYLLKENDKGYYFELLKGSENQVVNDIIIDDQSQVWLGTDMGIMLYRNLVFSEPYQDLAHNYIQDIRIAYNGNYFFSNGNHVFIVESENNISKYYSPPKGLVISLEVDEFGVWMGTNDGKLICKYFSGEVEVKDFSSEGKGIYNLEIDRESNLWIIQARTGKETLLKIERNGTITDFTPELIGNDRIRSLKATKNGDLYIGATSNENYLFKYNYNKKNIENISVSVNLDNNNTMSVNDLIELPNKHLLLATKLGLWELSKYGITQIDIDDMSNEMVSALAMASDESIWFANSNGIIKYSTETSTIYDNADGLPAKTVHFRSLKFNLEGDLLAGTISGLAIGKIQNREANTPKPIVSSFGKSGLKTTLDENNFVQNSLLDFAFATSVYPAKYVHYQYALNKDDKTSKWQDFKGYQDHIIFSDLEKGSYHLKVRAKNKGHYKWSDPFEYNFSIYKIWYTRLEILAIIYLVVFLLIWIYTRFNKAKNAKEKEKLEAVIESKTIDLRKQNEELTSLNANLKLAKDEAEDAVKTKDRFFSILAHDLKSPFNTIIGFSQLLVQSRKDFSEESLEQLLNEMLKTSENTYKLLQNLLDWAMSQTGALKIKKSCIILHDFLNEVLPTFEAIAEQKSIKIKVNIEKSLAVYADGFMLGTIVRNLISNAIKYSYNNSVIQVKGRQKNGIAIVEISDSGVGISPEKQQKLFKIDANNSTPGTADEIGTGLGLMLCSEFVRNLNGTIQVVSELNSGSTFIVQLPVNSI
ncbi:MAG: ATP-binding protein [Salinivirgaceae bacterium]|jgi:signal transduction histidine kinase|nr:ATP-binding protein [Salinivirgaceae bacterium]